MAKAKITKTSSDSATVEPFELRPGPCTRLVFKPEMVNNANDHDRPVKGELLWQKRSSADANLPWADERHLDLRTMRAGSGVTLKLSTKELYELTHVVRGLYGYFWGNNHQLPQDGEEFELSDHAQAAKTLDRCGNAADLLKIAGEDGFVSLIKLLAAQENSTQIAEALGDLALDDLSSLNAVAGVSLLHRALKVWQDNSTEPREEFWQNTLSEYSFVLSQVFSAPVVSIAEKAHVGGKTLTNRQGKLADFLFKVVKSDHVLLVEIKTPTTTLLGSQPYRSGVYTPSSELTGAVAQIATYKARLAKEFNAISNETRDADGTEVRYAEPRCVVIAGNTKELDTPGKKDGFELYRRGLRHADILTFDELFEKVRLLAELLTGTSQEAASQ